MSRPKRAPHDGNNGSPMPAEMVIDLAAELTRDITTEHLQRYDIESFRRRIERGRPDGLRPYTEEELAQNKASLAREVAKHAALCRRISLVSKRLAAAGEAMGFRVAAPPRHPLAALRKNLGKPGHSSEAIVIEAAQFLERLAGRAWLEKCPGKPLEFLKAVEADIEKLQAAEEHCFEQGLRGSAGGTAAATRDDIRCRIRGGAPAVSSLATWPGVNSNVREFIHLLRQWDAHPNRRSPAEALEGARMTVWKIQAAIAQPKVAELLARHGWRSDGQPVERPDTLDLLAADLEVERHVLATIDQGPYGVDGVVVARKLRCYQQRAVSLGGAADVPDVWPDDTIAVAQALAEVVKLLKWCAKHPTAAGGVTEVAPVGTEERRVATPSPGAALPAGAVYSRPMHKKEIAAELRVSVKTLSKRQETKGTFCIGTAAQNAPKQAFRFIVIVQVIS